MASSGNFCTLNRLVGAASNGRVNSGTMSLGNLKYEDSHSTGDAFVANMAMTGKTYCEVRIDSIGNYGGVIGLRGTGAYSQVYDSVTFQTNYSSGLLYHYKGSSDQSASGNIGGTVSAGNIVMFAYDPATYKWWVGVNGTWRNSGDPANGSGEVFTGSATMFETMDITWGGWVGDVNGLDTTWNFGQDSTFGGQETAGGNADGNGFGDFKYAPPTGFLALSSGNLSVSDDIDPAQTDNDFPQKNFNTITYTGNGSDGNSITGVGFQPDLVWVKNLSGSNAHQIYDSNRGTGKLLSSNNTDAEQTYSTVLQSFDSDGFTAGTSGGINGSGNNLVAWCWRANGGTTASNSEGSITSTVQANQAAGFSIITFTSPSSSADQTVGHGLSAAPEFIIVKKLNSTANWNIFHKDLSANQGLRFTTATPISNAFGSMDATTIGVKSPYSYASGDNYVHYAWHGVEGYSKFGTYFGTGNADGPFIYTGFRPRMIFVKRISTTGGWWVFDSARDTHNPVDRYIGWQEASTEGTNSNFDFLSSGFKLRTSDGDFNGSGSTIIYGAWADVPFKYNNAF